MTTCPTSLAVVVTGAYFGQRDQLDKLQRQVQEQHDTIVALESQVERQDSILDRAIDATAIARAVLEESNATNKQPQEER